MKRVQYTVGRVASAENLHGGGLVSESASLHLRTLAPLVGGRAAPPTRKALLEAIGNPDGALSLIELAQVRSDRLTSTTRAMLAALRAQFLSAVDRIDEALSRGDVMNRASESTVHILRRAAADAGVDVADAELLRAGSNDIFKLRNGIIARIGKPDAAAAAERELQVSRWLNLSGVPAVEAAATRHRPTVVDGRPVTWWRLIPDHHPASLAELGAALRRLHALELPTSFDLPQYQPFAGIHKQISTATALGDDVRQWLIQHYSRLRQRYEQLRPAQRKSVIHGDAWQGNLVVPRSGTPVFLDLDKVSVGRPEWDLIQLAVDHADFTRLSTADYQSFVTAYGGYDMTACPEFGLFAGIQELRWAAFAISLAHRNESARAEAAHRVACIRGHIPKPWTWNAL